MGQVWFDDLFLKIPIVKELLLKGYSLRIFDKI